MPGKSLQITYLGDAKSVLAAQQQIDRGHGSLDTSTKKTGSVFQTTFGSLMPIAAAAAGAAVVKFGIDSVKAFQEAEQVMAQTEAVLKSTGGAANVTAEQVTSLASRWQNLTGIEDDVIQTSSNLLLTFRGVVNEVGAGNDIFNQAQVAILDMATAMNQGALPSADQLKTATIQLGKALNDPIKGSTALARAGVQLTQAQKDQIETMVASGDVMGAQKVILGELENQFGGAAKAAGDTFAGGMAKARAKVDDLQEELGAVLAPAIEDVVTQMAELLETMGPVLEVVFTAAGEVIAIAAENLSDMAEPIVTILELLPELNKTGDESVSMFERLWHVAQLGSPERIFQKWEDVNTVLEDFGIVARDDAVAMEDQVRVMDVLSQAAADLHQRFLDSTEATREARAAHDHLTDAMREERLAALALTDSFIGIIDSGNAVSESQRELNRLERQGRDDTKAYEAAVLDALEAQIGLEDSVLSYAQELAESGETARTVKEKVRELGNQFGIQDSIVDDLIQQVLGYIRALNNIPNSVTTQLGVTTPSEIGGLQHGGIVRRPTVALLGEAGPEAVVPLGRGGGVAGVTINITGGTFVGSSPRELATLLVDEIHRELLLKQFRGGRLGFE